MKILSLFIGLLTAINVMGSEGSSVDSIICEIGDHPSERIVISENSNEPNPFHEGHWTLKVFQAQNLIAEEPVIEKSTGIRVDRYESDHYFVEFDSLAHHATFCGARE